MSSLTNEFGQPVGVSMKHWTPPSFPPHKILTGLYCQLEPLSAERHLQDLWTAQSDELNAARFTYLFFGPFSTIEKFEQWMVEETKKKDPQLYAIVVDGHALGMISYMRITPTHGAVEVGHVYYAPRLARTRAATEAVYLLSDNAFKLGYRRLEWKCDSLNMPSRNAATRFGFQYEGSFRQAVVYKGRTRDTTWFAIVDKDWNGGLNDVFQEWLSPDNFDEQGQQKLKLSELTASFVQNQQSIDNEA